jgi:hypothetical protein
MIRFKLVELLGVERSCDYLDDEAVLALIEHKLPPARLRLLEQHASSCADCSELLADAALFEQLAATGLQIPSERRAFRETDDRTRRRLGIGRRKKPRWPWPTWWIPAFGALALALLVVLLRPDSLLFQRIDGIPLVPPPSVRGITLAEVYDGLGPVWARDDMQAALPILERGVEENPAQQDLMFYLGVARVRSGRAAAAVEILETLDGLQSDFPSEHTRWYLAAAYDRSGRRAEACAMLRSVAALGGSRAKEAAAKLAAGCSE